MKPEEALLLARDARMRYRRDMMLWGRCHLMIGTSPEYQHEYSAAAHVILTAASRHVELAERYEEVASGRTPWLRSAPDEEIRFVIERRGKV